MLFALFDDPIITYVIIGILAAVLLVMGGVKVIYDIKHGKITLAKENQEVEAQEDQHQRNVTEQDRVDEQNAKLVKRLFAVQDRQQERIDSLEASISSMVKSATIAQSERDALFASHKQCQEAHQLCEERLSRLEADVREVKNGGSHENLDNRG